MNSLCRVEDAFVASHALALTRDLIKLVAKLSVFTLYQLVKILLSHVDLLIDVPELIRVWHFRVLLDICVEFVNDDLVIV